MRLLIHYAKTCAPLLVCAQQFVNNATIPLQTNPLGTQPLLQAHLCNLEGL